MGNDFPEPHQQLLERDAASSRTTTATCATSSSRSSRAACSCCRRASASAPPRPRCAWPSRWRNEGLIDKREAVLRVQPAQLDQLLHPQFDPKATYTVLAKGLNASPGAAVGKVYFTADDAEARHEAGERVILVRPGDLARRPARHDRGRGHPHVARRSRLARGGRGARHGQARDLRRRSREDRPRAQARSTVGGTTVREGDVISIDGTTGEIVVGEVPVDHARADRPRSASILGWADELRTLKVRTNADLPEDARKAREFGAEGIGLCRTEHMFLGDRLPIVQRMILADTPDEEARRARAAARAAGDRLRRASSRRWTACRSRCGCSTRRCTSSCPTTKS